MGLWEGGRKIQASLKLRHRYINFFTREDGALLSPRPLPLPLLPGSFMEVFAADPGTDKMLNIPQLSVGRLECSPGVSRSPFPAGTA